MHGNSNIKFISAFVFNCFSHVRPINMCDYFRSSLVAGQSNSTPFSQLFLNYNLLNLHRYIRWLMIKCKVLILYVCVFLCSGIYCVGDVGYSD